ncbi:pentatricopeptide repeat-containing protein At1g11290, chloroplastic-like [Papaver somniferum]|uniref:pentatricopeptide repeat-containing protein At1g11290, chloroplastic-like n=1 Tax=Papaver somniferum TaxID=3469 RepID=UPI000E6FCA66|nr:pentatricopeptide repeat-containing protein At1g11290, chloroplastic-like [Papaver somniferum]
MRSMISQHSKYLFHHFPSKLKDLPAVQTRCFSSMTPLLDFCDKIEFLQQIHARYIVYGHRQNQTLCSKLISSYANLDHLHFSQQVFNSVDNPNSLVYNTLLQSLLKFGKYNGTHLETVRKIHGHVIKLGYDLDVSALEEMYGLYGKGGGASELFEEMPIRDLTYWNLLISECTRNGKPDESFRLFREMRMEGLGPDFRTIISLLNSSVILNSIEAGKFVHLLIVLSNLSNDLSVSTALLTMYTKLGSLESAKVLFDQMLDKDCVVWNIMISAYCTNGYSKEALELLMQMGSSGVRTDLCTALAVISSATELKSLGQGKEVHAHVVRNGSDYQVSVHNSLIEMYCKCGDLKSARNIFDFIHDKTVVSWSSMIKGYANNGLSSDALFLFSKMRIDGTRFDTVTVMNVLPACVNLGALEYVKYFHGYSIKYGLISEVSMVTALFDSYAKCGCIEVAQKLFDEELDAKDVVSWNTMINAYSKHGNSGQCFELYAKMKGLNLRPDRITFLGLLTACVNLGLVKEGWECFEEMRKTYNCEPSLEHYACMVDLLGRTGNTEEAVKLLKSMPFEPDARIWGSILTASKTKSDTKLAEFATGELIKMEPGNAANYILLSNIYASAGKWDKVANMRVVLRNKGLKKTPGTSWLEISGSVHEFRVADRSHPKSRDIYAILGNLEMEIKNNTSKSPQLLS